MSKLLIPMGNHVLVEPLAISDKVGEGILVRAETYKQPSGQATVISVGPGRPGEPIDLKPGDRIAYNWINGREINLEGKSLRLLEVGEILGKFSDV